MTRSCLTAISAPRLVRPQCTVMKSTPWRACFSISANRSSGCMLAMSRSLSRICWPTEYMGTVPSGRGQAASMPVRMASRSPAMERSMTVSAPASRATASLRFSVCRQLHSGEVPILALTLMREGWPTTMGARPAWAGLPSRTMLPASMALVMVSGTRPSSWERAARCWSRRPRRAALRERMEDMGLHPWVWTQGAKKATTCLSRVRLSFPTAVRTASGSQGLGLSHSQPCNCRSRLP